MSDTSNGAVPAVRPPGRKRGMHPLLRLAAIAALTVFTLLFGVFAGTVIERDRYLGSNPAATNAAEPPLPKGLSTYQPQNDEERVLFRNLRKPSYSESIALSQAVAVRGRAISFEVFVATGNLQLPSKPLDSAVIIGLPIGTSWVSGPLYNIDLVMADTGLGSLPLAFNNGDVVYDSLCHPSYGRANAKGTCSDTGHTAAAPGEMYRSLRRMSDKEVGAHPGLRFIHPDVPLANVYMATGSIKLEPYFGPIEKTPVIVLGDGSQVAGGQFGKLQLVTGRDVSRSRKPYYALVHDPVYTAAMTQEGRGVCAFLSDNIKRQYYPTACAA